MGNPLPLSLSSECQKAQKILTEFVDPAHGGLDRVIPMTVLTRAQGLAIFSVARLGFLMSARAGSGVVIARLPDDSWSAPSALGLGGLGAGFNAGLDVTDFVIVLNNKQAVRSFMATGSLQLGGNLSVAVGPLGRAAEASGAVNSSGQVAAMFSYSKSKGLYGGVSVEGTILVDRADANSKAYHRSVSAKQILSGNVAVPSFGATLLSTIEKFTLTGEVRTGLDGRSASARGYGNYGDDEFDSRDDLERDFRNSQISSSPTDEWGYDIKRPSSKNDYAFGSKGHQTNSPTFTRKSFLSGKTSQVARGTDYKTDGSETAFDSTYMGYNRSRSNTGGSTGELDTFARSGVQPRKSSTTGAYNYDHGNNSRVRSQNASKRFPTTFKSDGGSSEEEFEPTAASDPFETPNYETSSYNYESRRPAKAQISSYRDKIDDLDVELDREAERKAQLYQADLIDLSTSNSNNSIGANRSYRRKATGLDSLDEELQRRDSMGTNSSHDHYPYDQQHRPAKSGWRSDYGLPDDNYAAPPSQRPPMHQRTSSAQKLWNRVRGNSSASRNGTPSFAETWEARSSRSTPRPDRNGGGGSRTTTPSNIRSTSSTTTTPPPAAFIAGAAAFERSTPPIRSGAAAPQESFSSPLNGADLQQVLAQFDFPGQEENDLAFKRGDIIDVIRSTDTRTDWWCGKVGDRIGNFPANYTVDL